MMQIEIRVNGVLIDYLDVVNTGMTDSNLGQRGSEYPRIYRVVHRGQRSDGIAPVGHYRSDGAIKLAAMLPEKVKVSE